MAMTVTDLALAYVALPRQPRQPAASFFYQGVMPPGVSGGAAGQRGGFGIPSQKSGEYEYRCPCDPNYQFAHVDPPFCLKLRMQLRLAERPN
jgi:hypothetical protein